jgi:hypothetical protein
MNRLPMQSVAMDFQKFISHHQTAILATINHDGTPNASYAPYLWHEGQLYIYVSELAKHTHNLIAHPCASVMVIEDETLCENIFARKRATLMTEVTVVPRESSHWIEIMNDYTHRLGETASSLKNLKDFHLFELRVLSASFVRGFAQAYTLDGDALHEVKHMNDRGHGQSTLDPINSKVS